MKKLILMLVVLMGVIVDVSAGIKIGIETSVTARKKWKVIYGTPDDCPIGKGLCVSFEITIGMEGLFSHNPDNGEITLEVDQNSQFARELGSTLILPIEEDSPVLDELGKRLKFPGKLRIKSGNYRPIKVNGKLIYKLNTF